MTNVPERLAQLLETLPTQERQEITAWLLGGRTSAVHWPPGPELRHGAPTLTRSLSGGTALASSLSVGEESQLVTIRLPADRHAELRTWCASHGFTMAAVIRGLIERFLDEQQPKTPAAGTGS